MRLKVCWLMDQRPGHLTKVRGILKALSCHAELTVQEIPVRWKPRFLRTILPHAPGAPASVCLQRPVEGPVDLIVSAGGATEWVNARLARTLSVPNIFLGSLRSCRPDAFTVLPRIEPGEASQILVMDLVPSEIDSASVQTALAAAPTVAALEGPHWCLLIGGDGSGCVWTLEDYAAQADRIIDEANRAGVKLLVTSSRRTGVEGERVWRERLEASDRLALGVWYSQRESEAQPRLAALLGKGDRLIITEDSASMVNEAVAAGKPVATIEPSATCTDALLDGMLQRLEANRRVVRLRGADWQLADIPDGQWSSIPSAWHAPLGRELLARIKPFLKTAT